uniref:Uncharacterized protein n=1 Tax=Magallana gigas TaxID=29159 RepID=A0A8W8LH40_MAGGI
MLIDVFIETSQVRSFSRGEARFLKSASLRCLIVPDYQISCFIYRYNVLEIAAILLSAEQDNIEMKFLLLGVLLVLILLLAHVQADACIDFVRTYLEDTIYNIPLPELCAQREAISDIHRGTGHL